MAATVESFSIREYVLKKRSVDLGTCWPFREETSRKEKKNGFNLLPPIVCRKFRWWAFENHKIKRSSTGDEDGAGGSKSNQELPENFETLPSTDFGGQHTVVLESDSGFDVGNLKAVLDGESGLEEEGSIVKICPVGKTFTSTTINAVNAHIDNCLAQASWDEKKQAKHKSRVPKKRSIVEIFAAAPHVETVDEEDEDERVREEEQEEKEEEQQRDEDNAIERDGFGLDQYGSIIEPQQQQTEEGRSEKVELSKARRRRNTKPYDEVSLPKRKEKQHRLKLPSPADFSRLPQAMLQKKNLKKLIAGPCGIQAKKPSNAKKVPKQKQLKIIRASKLVSKHLQVDPPVLPIHSILRNQVKPSGRHVRFSGKDDILGYTNKLCSPTGLSQMETLHKIISDAMADLSVKERPYSPEASYPSRNSQAINEARESIESDDDVSVIEGNGDKNLNDNALPSVISSNNRSCHDLEKVALSEPMDLNQALQQFDNLHVLNPGLSYLLNSFSKEGISPVTSTQTEGSASRIPCESKRLPASLENPTARFSNVSSLPNLSRTTTIHHPISCIGTNLESNVRSPFQLELNKQSFTSLLQYPLCPLPQEDLTASLHASLTEPKRRLTRKNGHFGESNMSSSGMIASCASRGKSIDEDFLGLPLNLSGKLGYNPLRSYPVYNLVGPKFRPDHFDVQDNTQNAKTPSNHNLIFFPDQNYSEEIQTNRPVSSMLGFTKLIDDGRMNELSRDSLKEKQLKSLSLSDSELPMVNIFGPGSQDYNQPQDIRGNEKSRGNLDFGYRHPTQPMVRLMGKNVMVGRSNNEEGQVFEESKIWKDKEITTGNEAVANQCFRQERITDLVSQASKDNENNSLDPYSSPNLPKNLQFPSSEPGFDHTFLSSSTHLMSRNDLSLRNGRYGTNFNNLVYLPSQALPSNQKSKPINNFISGIESSQISHQNPITACNPLGACIQHYHNFPYREKSAFQFPFSNQDFGENIQSSWPQSPPSSLPQWLLTATQQKETPQSSEPSQVYSDPIGRTNSMICGTHLLPSPPFLTSAHTFSTHKPNTSNPCLKNSYTVPSLNKPLLMPAFPGYKPTYAIDTSRRNRSKLQQKCNSKFTPDTGRVKKVKKRPATKGADPTKPIKRMKVGMQEKSSMTQTGSKKREQLCEYTLHNAGASELDICRGKTMDAFFSAIDIDRNGLKAGGGIICFNQDGLGRLGPIKLSAGAKHILKPSQNAHQDGSRPTHSTIPFMLATGADKAPDLQKKAAKIYRF